MSSHPIVRSKLFVPASRPELFEKALGGESDGLTLDLEDGVAAAAKPAARRHLADLLDGLRASGGHAKVVIVRVNHPADAAFSEDLDVAVRQPTRLINLPKLESAAEVQQAAAAIGRLEAERGIAEPIGLLVNVESPRGLRLAHEIAGADPRIAALQFGLADLFAPLRIARVPAALGPVRLAVRLAAAEAGVGCYDTVWTDVGDRAGFERDAREARALGFLGKSCIHPTQVPIANRVFTPGEKEIAAARRVLAALGDPANAGRGAFTIDGRMVDEPFFRAARATLALARRLGIADGAD